VVGAGAKILGPITVGRGTRVGANSVVIESTPPEVTVVGIPARVVRRNSPIAAWSADRSGPPSDARSGRRGNLGRARTGSSFSRLGSPICRSGCATAAVPHGTTRGRRRRVRAPRSRLRGVFDMSGSVESGILAQLNKASSAEDFFALLASTTTPSTSTWCGCIFSAGWAISRQRGFRRNAGKPR